MKLFKIYYKENKDEPSFLEVLFETNHGYFYFGLGSFDKFNSEIEKYMLFQDFENYKQKKGIEYSFIKKIKYSYDNNMFALIDDNNIISLSIIPTSSGLFSIIQELELIDNSSLGNSFFEFFEDLENEITLNHYQ